MSSMEQQKLEMELGLELETQNNTTSGIDIPEGYTVVQFNEYYDEDIIQGKPQLSEVIESRFDDDGEEKTTYHLELWVLDDMEEEATRIRINLKTPDNTQVKVHEASKLYKLVKGVVEMKVPRFFDGYNRIKTVDLDKLRSEVNGLDEITIKVREESMNRGETLYNSFTVVNSDNYAD